MKKVTVKRIVYYSPTTGEEFLGATEYDGNLTDENILCSIHEVGKTAWLGPNLWVIHDDQYIYRLTVQKFYQYTKSRFELFLDAIRRT